MVQRASPGWEIVRVNNEGAIRRNAHRKQQDKVTSVFGGGDASVDAWTGGGGCFVRKTRAIGGDGNHAWDAATDLVYNFATRYLITFFCCSSQKSGTYFGFLKCLHLNDGSLAMR